jgi:hypothetical protein
VHRQEEGSQTIAKGIADYDQTGATMMTSYFQTMCAEACLDLGYVEEANEAIGAIGAIGAALDYLNINGVRFFEPETRRIHALIGRRLGNLNSTEALTMLDDASRIATQQGNDWELHRIAADRRLLGSL